MATYPNQNDQENEGLTLLDEPQREPRVWRVVGLRLELLIGIVLLLGIVGWAVWDSWRNQGLLNSYRAGQHYAAQKDWDAARAAYQAAEGFKDAATRAAEAGANIARRDQHYDAAVAEIGRNKWLAALRDLRVVADVQPGYRDSASRLDAATQQVYSGTLSGTIALRPLADPPGLYTYEPGGWVWLSGSDATSSVRGNGGGCIALYDVPADPGATQRSLAVARRQDAGLAFEELVLTPDEPGLLSCGARGVVAERYAAPSDTSSDPRLALVGADYNSKITVNYQSYDSAVTSTFSLPGTAWAIIGRGRSSDELLLGDFSQNSAAVARTDLYVAELGGGMRLVATRNAVVQNARISPDGNSLLLEELALPPVGGSAYLHRLVDLAVDGSRPAALLRSWADDPPLAGGWFWSWFIDAGPYAGKVLLGGSGPWDSEIWLIDPAQPGQVLWKTAGGPNERFAAVYPLSSGLLLSWMEIARPTEVRFSYLDHSGVAQPVDLGTSPAQWIWSVWQAGDRLVYASAGGSDSDSANNEIRSLSLYVPYYATALLATTVTYGQSSNGQDDPGISWNPGADALALVRNGELHAISYDGAVDLLLERGIAVIYAPR